MKSELPHQGVWLGNNDTGQTPSSTTVIRLGRSDNCHARGVGSRHEVGAALRDVFDLGNDDLLRPLALGLTVGFVGWVVWCCTLSHHVGGLAFCGAWHHIRLPFHVHKTSFVLIERMSSCHCFKKKEKEKEKAGLDSKSCY
jgi:hypothetical protein